MRHGLHCSMPPSHAQQNVNETPLLHADFWLRPSCQREAELFDIVMRKMFHRCGPVGEAHSCRAEGHCKYGFPYKAQPERLPQVKSGGVVGSEEVLI